MNDFQKKLEAEKWRGFDDCRALVDAEGLQAALEKLRAKNNDDKDVGYWMGWMKGCSNRWGG